MLSSSEREISIIAPVFNEEAGIKNFCQRVRQVMDQSQLDYELVLVDDGSTDQSVLTIKALHKSFPRLRLICLARNFGHQLALTAGLNVARGKAVIVLDSDLQDPPEVMPEFIKKWREGYDIVYGVRKERKGETWFKKTTAFLFYRLLGASTKIDIPKDAGDFYLLDRKVVEVINKMEERHRFMRGLLAWVGFRRIGVEYVREARTSGVTKYSLWKMIKFSLDAATSFSFVPLRMISFLGLFISLLAFVGILFTIYIKFFTQLAITGWSSIMVAVLFIGGIQLIAIGIIGEYLARIGDDVKGRPLYVIKEEID